MTKGEVLKKLRRMGYLSSEKTLDRYVEAGWCPDHCDGEYPEDTIEELIASMELQDILDAFTEKPKKNFRNVKRGKSDGNL